MIDPRSLYIIYKQQEGELELEIEHRRAARENGQTAETSLAWLSGARKWLKEVVTAKRQRLAAEHPT